MTIILFDTPRSRASFFPFALTRPVCDLRHGILTLKEKWSILTGLQTVALTEDLFQIPFPPTDDHYIYIDAAIIPGEAFVEAVIQMKDHSGLRQGQRLLAIKTHERLGFPIHQQHVIGKSSTIEIDLPVTSVLEYPWQLFQTNEQAIRDDFKLLTAGRLSAAVSASNTVIGTGGLFMEAGVEMEACILNTNNGPVYIGKNASVMEGSMLRGPVAIGDFAVVKMGTQLYGGTTIGPFCTAGGEIKNSILLDHSNKGHHGYLGDAIIGEWCNLGAGTSNSNVKNTGGIARMWNPLHPSGFPVGKKAGLLLGDHCRTAVNTTFNTGTVTGVSCNIFGTEQPPKYIPSFCWGNEQYELDKAISHIERWKQMKGKRLETIEKEILTNIYSSAYNNDSN